MPLIEHETRTWHKNTIHLFSYHYRNASSLVTFFFFSEQRGLRPFPLLGERKIGSTLRSCHVIAMNLHDEIKAVKHRLTLFFFFFPQKQFSIINSTIQSWIIIGIHQNAWYVTTIFFTRLNFEQESHKLMVNENLNTCHHSKNLLYFPMVFFFFSCAFISGSDPRNYAMVQLILH